MTADANTLSMIRKTAADFSKKELIKNREELDNKGTDELLRSILDKAFDMDFFHSAIPEPFGGTGLGITGLCAILEEICCDDASLGCILFSHAFSMKMLVCAGAEDLLETIRNNGNSANQIIVACPCSNNPSEVEHIADAIPDKDSYILSGQIPYVVPAILASRALIPGRIKGQEGYSWFMVDFNQAGVKAGKPVTSLGMHACQAVDLELVNAKGILAGHIGKGAEIFESAANTMHLATAAMASGIMKGSLKEALDYASKRNQGGRKIINWSELRMILADMAVQSKVAEMIVAKACELVEKNFPGWEHASRAAAIHALSAACDLTTNGVQVLGGVGYMKDFGQEKRMRDAKQVQALLGIFPLKKLKYLEKK